MADTIEPQVLPADTAAALAEFARGCKAAARAVSLYPGQHPAIGTSLARLVEATSRLTATGPLVLQVRSDALLLAGAAMPKPDQAVTELADLLHRHLIGAITINAGVEPLDLPQEDVRLMNRLQQEAASPWDHTRLDAFTFRQAMAYLEKARPRVLYIAFDETDDWAHDGRYDKVLDTYVRTDGYLRELWTWLQAQPDYRGRTHMLITTDHGRGATASDWRHHGDKYPGAEHVWMAFVTPKMAQRGEWKDAPPVSTSQIAATLASWAGVDWNADHPDAGKPIR